VHRLRSRSAIDGRHRTTFTGPPSNARSPPKLCLDLLRLTRASSLAIIVHPVGSRLAQGISGKCRARALCQAAPLAAGHRRPRTHRRVKNSVPPCLALPQPLWSVGSVYLLTARRSRTGCAVNPPLHRRRVMSLDCISNIDRAALECVRRLATGMGGGARSAEALSRLEAERAALDVEEGSSLLRALRSEAHRRLRQLCRICRAPLRLWATHDQRQTAHGRGAPNTARAEASARQPRTARRRLCPFYSWRATFSEAPKGANSAAPAIKSRSPVISAAGAFKRRPVHESRSVPQS
jgi:hypothetical protein